MIGFFYLWVSIFGSSFLGGYLSYLGLDASGFLGATLDPHSHEMAVALVAGVVAIAVQQFGVLDKLRGAKRVVAKTGVWVSIIGVIGMTAVFLASAFANYSPPTLFASPDGVNGVAGDDMVMGIVALGAMVILIPMSLTKSDGGTALWRNPIRGTVLATWVAAVLVNIVAGFYVEFHEDAFSGSLAANDQAFAQMQSLTGLFVLGAAAMVLLTVDRYGVQGLSRKLIALAMPIGVLLTVAGGFSWVFVDPSKSGLSFGTYVAGALLIGVAALVTAASVHFIKATGPAQPLTPSNPT